MALLWIEGFESFGTSVGSAPTGLSTKYTQEVSSTNTILATGRVSGYAVKISHGGTLPRLVFAGLGSHATMIVGFAYQTGATLGNNCRLISFYEGATEHFSIHIQNSGELSAYRASSHLATTSGLGIVADAWYYIEVSATIGNTGAYEIRVNGVNVLSDGSEDTQNGGTATADTIRFFGNCNSDAGDRVAYDDIYILDTTGSDNNTFLGSQKVVAIYPTGSGDSTQLTPNTGSNWAAVDDNPHDTDTTYIESATSGHQDLYACGNVDLTDIKGIQINALCRETDGTPFSIKLVSKTGSTVDEGSGLAIGSTSYVSRSRILEEDPDTSSAWTDSGIDGAQFGVEVA